MVHSTTTHSLPGSALHPPIQHLPTSNSQTFTHHNPYNPSVYQHNSYHQSYSHRPPMNALTQPYPASSYQTVMPSINYQSSYISNPYNSYQSQTPPTSAPYLLIQHQPYGTTASYQAQPIQHKDTNTNITSSMSSVSLNSSTANPSTSNELNQQFSNMSINATSTNSTNITQLQVFY